MYTSRMAPAGGSMGPTALSQLVRSRVRPWKPWCTCCRDRNLLGRWTFGAHALDCATYWLPATRPRWEPIPTPRRVRHLHRTDLVHPAANRTHFSQPIGGKTELFVGTGCNPGAVDIALESERFLRKVAGAEYTFSQPLFDDSLRTLPRSNGSASTSPSSWASCRWSRSATSFYTTKYQETRFPTP